MPTVQSEAPVRDLAHSLSLISSAALPTKHGLFRIHVFRENHSSVEHIALVRGSVYGSRGVLVRVHSECLTGDVLGSKRCDCGEQLDAALSAIANSGQGVLIYLRGHEGRGIGIGNKIRAYALQDGGCDTVEANIALGLPVDGRSFAPAAEIIAQLGVRSITLITNNPDKVAQLGKHGVDIGACVNSLVTPTSDNENYLLTKQLKLGHALSLPVS